ncbi:prion-inhibition and propagation-domain-containing protein [Cladorrhinum sp. PSN332]|nr:prion-inhibition and propagation-domain-containing protein [Cladorrhinum sp. PSN332]
MDPLSILGAAVGATSLIIQLADECIKVIILGEGFKLFSEATNMPDSLRYLRVSLQIEQHRFLNFSLEAGILFADGVLCSTLQVNRPLLLAVLAEIKTLFETYATESGRYETGQQHFDAHQNGEPGGDLMHLLCLPSNSQPPPPPPVSPPGKTPQGPKHLGDLAKRIARTGRRLRTIVVEPKRLVWSAMDKESFTQLIAKIENLNSFLISLLDSSQIKRLKETVYTTYLETVQIRSGVDSLTTLVKALSPNTTSLGGTGAGIPQPNQQTFLQAVSEEAETEVRRREYVKRLAELKIKYTEANQQGGDASENGFATKAANRLLDLQDLGLGDAVLEKSEDFPRRMPAVINDSETRVWIEWKRTPIPSGTTDISLLTEGRIAILADLLSQEKPVGFRSPACIGYVKKEIRDPTPVTYFGVVYKIPETLDTNEKFHMSSLRELFLESPKPSLNERMALCVVLARCIHAFHTISWLHKGLRSDNIIFLGHHGSEGVQLTSPFVTGLELSRPSIIEEMTEKPEFDPLEDIYRHPKAQSAQADASYRSTYDIYSLGIIFIEIAFWRRIEEVVRFTNWGTVKPSTMRRVKPWLLGTPFKEDAALPPLLSTETSCLRRLAPECGASFRDIVERCLTADDVEGISQYDQSESHVELGVQRMMENEVVKRLGRIANAL